jgi:hypothetical protein
MNQQLKNTLLSLAGLGVFLLLAFGSLDSTNENTSSGTNAITISAEDLSTGYNSNEADADKLYQGKILIVTGTVGATEMQIPAVNLVDAHTVVVQCRYFPTDQMDAISKLKVGQTVSVKGKCMGQTRVLGMKGEEVYLQDCVVQ